MNHQVYKANEQISLLNEQQAAERLGFRVQTLRNWRCKGKGPVYLKVGSHAVRYTEEDLAEFATARRIIPDAEPRA